MELLLKTLKEQSFKKSMRSLQQQSFMVRMEKCWGEVLLEEMRRIEIFNLFDSWGVQRKVLKKIQKEDL